VTTSRFGAVDEFRRCVFDQGWINLLLLLLSAYARKISKEGSHCRRRASSSMTATACRWRP